MHSGGIFVVVVDRIEVVSPGRWATVRWDRPARWGHGTVLGRPVGRWSAQASAHLPARTEASAGEASETVTASSAATPRTRTTSRGTEQP